MSWIVFTAPELTEKLVELKLAIPLAAVVASAAEMTPVAETEIGADPATATVPELLGMIIVLAAVGLVKLSVIELLPELPRISEVPIYPVLNW